MGSLAAGAVGVLGRDGRCAAGLWSGSRAMLRERGLGGSSAGGLEFHLSRVPLAVLNLQRLKARPGSVSGW